MASFYDSISPDLQEWIEAQHIVFVASAHLRGDGHDNLSPKGLDCFRVLSPNRVAYLDLTGSGNETSAHLAENGRVTFMFCSFESAPRILRLFGRGQTILPGDSEWESLRARFPANMPGLRQFITADIYQVQTSCGFGVPFMRYEGERETLVRHAESLGLEKTITYQQEKNAVSLDGLAAPLAGVH